MSSSLSRRCFLGTSVAFAGCAGVPSAKRARIGVQLASVRDLIKAQGLEKTLAELAALGFEGVELVGQPGYYGKGIPAYQGLSAAQIKSALGGVGLAPCGAHEAMRDLFPENIKKTLDFVCAYGGSFVACTMGAPRTVKPEEARD